HDLPTDHDHDVAPTLQPGHAVLLPRGRVLQRQCVRPRPGHRRMWLHGAAAVVWRVRHAVLRRNVSGGVDVPDREPPADGVSWRAQRVSLRPHAVTDRGRPERPAILARGVSSRLGVLIVATACAIATTTVRSGHADDGSLLESWLAQRTATGTW